MALLHCLTRNVYAADGVHLLRTLQDLVNNLNIASLAELFKILYMAQKTHFAVIIFRSILFNRRLNNNCKYVLLNKR